MVSILLVYVGPSQGCRQGGQCHQGGHQGGQVHEGVVIFSVGVYRGSVNYAQDFFEPFKSYLALQKRFVLKIPQLQSCFYECLQTVWKLSRKYFYDFVIFHMATASAHIHF